jgi:hypothetical protein
MFYAIQAFPEDLKRNRRPSETKDSGVPAKLTIFVLNRKA